MADNIDTSTGKAAIAFRGSRDDIWHRMGQQHEEGWTIDDWARNAGLEWYTVKCPAFVDMSDIALPMDRRGVVAMRGTQPAEGRYFIVRSDNGHILSPGVVTERYQLVQPRDVLDWFERYIAVDDRFQLDVAGSLRQGEIIWATATFNGDLAAAGDRHVARLLMTTTFDGSGSTINRGCMTRVVCNNTLDAALAEGKTGGAIRTRHSTRFDAEKVGRELAAVAKSFVAYKAMAEAMACHHMASAQISRLFKTVLDIPFDAKLDDVSARKRGAFDEINTCYKTGIRQEGLQASTAWAALNAVTRYADHNKPARGDDKDAARFASSVADMSGSGAAMKAAAVAVLADCGVSW